jgi:syntaxin 1B/2/3
MLRSSDYDKTRSAYRETQTRHEELQNIENTLTELAQLFNEASWPLHNNEWYINVRYKMAIIVEQDDDKIDTLVNQTNAVEEDTRKGWVP